MQQEPSAWHAFTGQHILAEHNVSLEHGLTYDEVTKRQAQFGLNQLPIRHARPAWLRLLLQFHNPLIYVLLAAGAVTVAMADYVDAAVILAVVIINTFIGFVQEGKAEKSLEAVRSMLANKALVLRDGQRSWMAAEQLVPGDVVFLESGDKVPADIRLLHAKNLQAAEAALTGESVPVSKSLDALDVSTVLADRLNMVYSGTLITAGQASGVVVETGIRTEIGRIGAMVGELQTLSTPLTQRLDQFARHITALIVGVGLLTFGYGSYFTDLDTMQLFLAVVGLSVAAIPEGLPAIVTVVLAIGTRAMARNRAIIRRLPAVETLGSVTVICSDKTGTLTRNEMTATKLVFHGKQVHVSGTGYAPLGQFTDQEVVLDPAADSDVQAAAHCAMLCNDAELRVNEQGQWTLVGDPTEGALMALAQKAGLQPESVALRFLRIDAIPFESEYRYMAVLVHDAQGQRSIMLKGAPEVVLKLCSHQSNAQALHMPSWEQAVHDLAQQGHRVLALAQLHVSPETHNINHSDIQPHFTLLGLVGLIDPPRDEAIEAVALCQKAGIRVKMITGDHVLTATSIGQRLGLSTQQTLTGENIEHMSDQELQNCAADVDVIARASPEHKLRLVAALQARGHLVAMTGDGVNDAPALKSANIGVAMGHKGTDAAREASDLVLTDDNFATIASAVREGRVVFDNIKKSLLFILPTNGGQAGVILLAIYLGLTLPITAGQILWVNLVTAVTLALALAFEPAEPLVMLQAPRPSRQPLLTGPLLIRILFVSVLIVGAAFGVFNWSLARGDAIEVARTAAVNMVIFAELGYIFHARHYTRSALNADTLTGNRMVLWMAGLLVLLQLALTYAWPLQVMFKTAAIDGATWALIGALSIAVFALVELEKWVWRLAGLQRM
jgi:magnesium-transporting ATPase (P-type)